MFIFQPMHVQKFSHLILLSMPLFAIIESTLMFVPPEVLTCLVQLTSPSSNPGPSPKYQKSSPKRKEGKG